LSVPGDQLAAAAWCDPSVTAESGKQAVLLIHGSGSAVYAARFAYQRSGCKSAIIGHSQGALMAVWIAKFWPEVADHATDVIGLSGPMNGSRLLNTLCVAGSCAPLGWQVAMGSHTTAAAINAPLPATAAFTSIGSRTDEFVFPEPQASTLAGATTVMVQDRCPLRVVDHVTMFFDAVGCALVLDSRHHAGPAASSRMSPAAGLQLAMPNVDLLGAAPIINSVAAVAAGLLDPARWVNTGPALPEYARPYGEPSGRLGSPGVRPVSDPEGVRMISTTECLCLCVPAGHQHHVCTTIAEAGKTVPLPGSPAAVPACTQCHSAVLRKAAFGLMGRPPERKAAGPGMLTAGGTPQSALPASPQARPRALGVRDWDDAALAQPGRRSALAAAIDRCRLAVRR
jgi:hypothetical protein